MSIIYFIGGCYDTVKRNPALNFQEKTFSHKNLESHAQSRWQKNAKSHILPFSSLANSPELSSSTSQTSPFSIPFPPPNITGKLHLGHAIFLSIQDALIRYHTLMGRDTLWIPGTDHAGLATHEKIMCQFELDNIPYSEEEYMRKAWKWTEEHQDLILNQFSKLGIACDWDKEEFTLNPSFQKASRTAFERLMQKGKITKTKNSYFLDFKDEAKKLAANIRSGHIDIQPAMHANRLLHMLDNMTLWDIGRDIPWGIKIPTYETSSCETAFRLNEGEKAAEEIESALTFDTWFTSSLWPLATMGWPEETNLYKNFYPQQIMETGYDILFFWAARTLLMCEFLTGEYPFKTILLHGLLRDNKNQKFSKSLGNGIDPLDLLENYGADAIRLYCIGAIDMGQDSKFNPSLISSYRRELQKIYSAARLMILKKEEMKNLAQLEGKLYQEPRLDFNYLTQNDKQLKIDYSALMENYKLKDALTYLLTEFRDEFCNGYIQSTKQDWENTELFSKAYSKLYYRLMLLQPFIPHLSEELLLSLNE